MAKGQINNKKSRLKPHKSSYSFTKISIIAVTISARRDVNFRCKQNSKETCSKKHAYDKRKWLPKMLPFWLRRNEETLTGLRDN